MKSLTICMLTTRPQPEVQWMLDSLHCDEAQVMVIHGGELIDEFDCERVKYEFPKPNVWQGEHRKTPVDWWAKSNAINTALCLCKTEWICFLDDRCVLQPGFMDAIRSAMTGNYIMAGAYEKRHSVTVENGVIRNAGIITGTDSRVGKGAGAVPCSGHWLFGCVTAAPLDWWLQINGAPEKCDSLGFEDVIIGMLFQNNKFPIRYDMRARIIEDRSVDKLGTVMRRESKEKHPHDTNDKAHKLLAWVNSGAKRSENDFDIRELRDKIQSGGEFPIPEDKEWVDWFDSQPLKEML